MANVPFFSIVTPVFNRQGRIRQAIASVQAQEFTDYEHIVVDDGSTDGSAAAAASYPDPRIRLLRHSSNRGACPARNTAVRAAQGEWIVYLDSDDELLPQCLARVFEAVSKDGPGIGRFGFYYEIDRGGLAPLPAPGEGVLGYEDWLRFIDAATWSDALWVTRRSTYRECMMSETLGPELKYNLDFSRRFHWRFVSAVVARVHTDAPDRLSQLEGERDRGRLILRERDRLAEWNAVLAEHGAALRAHAPRRYEEIRRARALSQMMTGRRVRGLMSGLACLRDRPQSPANWVLLGAALAGPEAIHRGRQWRARRFFQRHTPATQFVQGEPTCGS
jgi:glycosyltransferase involved in cell wall biosynthesis